MPRTDSRAAFTRKLRTKMLTLILAAVLIAMVVLGFVIWHFARTYIAREIQERIESRVELAAATIEEKLDRYAALLELIAMRELAMPAGPTINRIYFSSVVAQHRASGVVSVYMGLEKGEYVTGGGWTPPSTYDHHERPWYKAASTRRGTVFTDPYRDARSGKAAVTVARAIHRQGRLHAVVGMDVFLDELRHSLSMLNVGQGGRALLLNSSGECISCMGRKGDTAHTGRLPDLAALFRQLTSSGGKRHRVRLLEGRALVLVSPIAGPGWYLVFTLPRDSLDGPLQRLKWLLLLSVLLCMMLLSLGVLYFSHRVTRPVLSLAGGAQRVAAGDLGVQLPIESSDELGYVSYCFNDMVDGLRDREFIKSTFGRYVSKEVMREILSGKIALGGEKMILSVLFSDIRGFTSFSEKMDPMTLVKLLNGYFTRMDRAISRAGGSINKYMGDGILAIFGAPRPLENSAVAALNAAWAKVDALDEFCRDLDVELQIGIGIHTGEAVVGNIGSSERTEYTVIGDTVNLASRVESLTKLYGAQVLITEATRAELPEEGALLFKVVDRVRVKGKSRPVTLYEPFRLRGMTAPERAHVARVNSIMALYFEGEFAKVHEALGEISDLDTHTGLILERVRQLTENPPERWDGVSTMTRK